MITLLFRALNGPLNLLAACGGAALICGFFACCFRCRLRDCACCKKLLRFIGYDLFDGFDLMVLVHEARFQGQNEGKSHVRLTAGRQVVETDPAQKGQYQQPLQLFVEQGAPCVTAELVDSSSHVLASVDIDIIRDILCSPPPAAELPIVMKVRSKIRSALLVVTMVPTTALDEEKGLLGRATGNVNWLVQQQLRKAQEVATQEGVDSELDVLKIACSGTVDKFENFGKAEQVYISIVGPPHSRRWALGIWHAKADFDKKHRAIKEVDLLKVQSVQEDPTRANVFVVVYVNEHRATQRLMFRRVDRARDVWVDLLQLLVAKVRDTEKHRKSIRMSRGFVAKSNSHNPSSVMQTPSVMQTSSSDRG